MCVYRLITIKRLIKEIDFKNEISTFLILQSTIKKY